MRWRIVQACLLVGFLLALQSTPILAERRIAGGIWCKRAESYALSGAHEDQLVRSLRKITGFQRLSFAEDGSLSLGDFSDVRAGSPTARQIILCALGSGNAFVIEDHSGSPTIVFAQVAHEIDFKDRASEQKVEAWRLQVDFDDFREIEAPPDVRQSFDVGFIVLHELLHGVGYQDTTSSEEIGELERLVNLARAELGLPLRDQYFGEPLPMTSRLFTFRLRFRRLAEPAAGRNMKRGRLSFLYFVYPLRSY
ncbi:MAG: hypothetical protein J2P31_14670 [Blastocatellia bacterium]|nr:hypothetical protein [Blastocatellia bacterium]